MSDEDGDTFSLSTFTQALNGTVTKNPSGTLHYAPAQNFYGQDSFTYTVTDVAGGSDTAIVNVTVKPLPPTVTTGPVSQTVFAGTNIVLTGAATAVPPPYLQWFLNSQPIAVATNATLALTSISANQAGNYALQATNLAGFALSTNATLTVLTPILPSISTQPQSAHVILGGTVTLSAAASAFPEPVLQWSKDGLPIPGATNSVLKLSGVTASSAGSYTLSASNYFGLALSAAAVLSVDVPLQITVQPIGQTGILGSNLVLNVTATGTAPLSYQWQFGATNLPGATLPSLALTNLATNQSGAYRVVVTNLAGTVISSNAQITVIVPPRVVVQPLSQTAVATSNVTFSVSSDGTTPFAYQWSFNARILPGATNSIFTLANAQATNAGSYDVVITNLAGSVTSDAAVLTVISPPVIVSPPASANSVAGGSATFSVTAIGTVPLEYQWRFSGTNIAAATNSVFSLTNIQSDQTGGYSVEVSNQLGSVQSAPALLTLGPLTLSVSRTASGITLQWPGSWQSLVLQSADNLKPIQVWAPVTNQPVLNGDQKTVTIPTVGNSRFFRLSN